MAEREECLKQCGTRDKVVSLVQVCWTVDMEERLVDGKNMTAYIMCLPIEELYQSKLISLSLFTASP